MFYHHLCTINNRASKQFIQVSNPNTFHDNQNTFGDFNNSTLPGVFVATRIKLRKFNQAFLQFRPSTETRKLTFSSILTMPSNILNCTVPTPMI
uniref:Uncharacterized protein n=2 Tax=Picea TaxID=3328 RepID=A0A101LWT3_PICGL|nr:hypothetical protein ABT39_MTgene6251 [Picea glauca]QHR92634.1 hypothetical protein Q903MT_gene6681 [Picea sitchensis]